MYYVYHIYIKIIGNHCWTNETCARICSDIYSGIANLSGREHIIFILLITTIQLLVIGKRGQTNFNEFEKSLMGFPKKLKIVITKENVLT